MKFVKLFENFESLENEVDSIWGVNPYLVFDIINSNLGEFNFWGEVEIDFSFFGPTPTEYPESLPCFKIEGGVLRKYIYHNNMVSIMGTGDYDIIIEGCIYGVTVPEANKRHETWEKFKKYMNDQLFSAGIDYSLTEIDDIFNDGSKNNIYLRFYKKDQNIHKG